MALTERLHSEHMAVMAACMEKEGGMEKGGTDREGGREGGSKPTHLCSSSQPSVTSVTGDLIPSSYLLGHQQTCSEHTCTQAKHT